MASLSFLCAKKTCPFMKRGISHFVAFPLLLFLILKIERSDICQMRESQFQAKLIKDLKKRFPGCIVMKSDAGYLQGIPDLLILYNDKWASLECKQSVSAKKQPNQEYYVDKMNEMSFSHFIYPENKEEVLSELQQTFQS